MSWKYLKVQLCDLPDEILMIIFKKLDNIQVLNSLIDVNKRLNKILHEPIFTNYLSLMRRLTNDHVRALPSDILDRFCLQILPSIHNKIRWIDLESSSMERILLSANYSNLYGLGLYDIHEETILHLFTDETVLTDTIKNGIVSLVIDVNTNKKGNSINNVNLLVFTHILTIFNNLRYLSFGPSRNWYQRFRFNKSPSVVSSTLLELHVCVDYFDDCLYFLDGRFDQLHTFCVDLKFIVASDRSINKKRLPYLKCFTLYSDTSTEFYYELVIPLLHRMSSLKKLDLCLTSVGNNRFIDGYELKKDIINHMTQLKKFTFNIRSSIHYPNQIDFPSNKDIQYTFRDFKDDQIISCVDYFSASEEGHCHVYSYPYRLRYYDNITNNFPGGLFKCVNEVLLYDQRPFEHQFFLRIQESFPLLQKLTLLNEETPNKKECSQSKNANQPLAIIKYPHLIQLTLNQAHEDYLDQFLIDTKMCLSNGIHLFVDYKSLQSVTHNFTRDVTRTNCAKVSDLLLINRPECVLHLKDYFPHAKIF